MMGRRGIAIAVVLMISALLLVCAFGIAAMATMPLNLARANVASVQQELTAQAALEQVRYELLVAEESTRIQNGAGLHGIDLSHPPTLGIDLRQRFDNEPVFVPAGVATGTDATITFNPAKPWYSVDNSLSDTPAPGVEGKTAVAPFTIDLMITVRGSVGPTEYEVMLTRLWDQAVFCTHGVHVAGGSDVTGNVGVNGTLDASSPRIVLGDDSGRAVHVAGDGDVFFDDGADPSRIINGSWVLQQNGAVFDGSEVHQYDPKESALTANGIAIAMPNPASGIFTHLNPLPSSADGTGIRDFAQDGDVLVGQPAPKPPPIIGIRTGPPDAIPTNDDMFPVPAPGPPSDNPGIRYLTQDLVLPDQTGSTATQFAVDASVVNYSPTKNKNGVLLPPSQWNYSDATMVLKNCLLYVNGNVDLTKGPNSDPQKPTLLGDNATLIVGGTLRISKGFVTSGNHGFVILARSISLEAGGEYNGLVVAQHTMRIQPRTFDDLLTIRGGLLADGSDVRESVDKNGDPTYQVVPINQALVVSATKVVYDARYLKSLMGLGRLVVHSWRQAP